MYWLSSYSDEGLRLTREAVSARNNNDIPVSRQNREAVFGVYFSTSKWGNSMFFLGSLIWTNFLSNSAGKCSRKKN